MALDATSAHSLERFEREAKSIAALNHPGICAVYDVGTSPVAFLVMEFLEGETRQQRLTRGALLTHFPNDARQIADFAWSADGKRIAVARSTSSSNIVLFRGLSRPQ